MTSRYLGKTLKAAFLCIVALSLTATVFGQGKGSGGGGGRGSGGGAGHSGGPPPGVGVDRGLGNASRKSNGRSDDGLETASSRSNGRSDEGLNRARMASDNLRRANEELRDHPGLANKLHLNANDLRDGYRSALSTNPNLKFGHYVAATRLAQNLGTRFPNVTRAAILNGLASGDSLGRTLQNLGLSSQQASDAKKRVEREIKQAKQ